MTTTHKSEAPIFVIGSPRSGTTLLRLMLTNHPRICIPPECGFMVWLRPRYRHIGPDELRDPAFIDTLSADIAASRKFETWNLSADQVAETLREADPANFADACAAVYGRYAASRGKLAAIWGDKNNYYVAHVSELHDLYGDARFLHIVRDGRDVACSYREVMATASASPYRPRLPKAIDEIAGQWAHDVRSVSAALAQIPQVQVREICYEHLVTDAAAHLSEVCAWLHVPMDSKMLEFNVANSVERLEPAATMDWKMRTLDPVSANRVGRFERELSAEERMRFLDIAGAELEKYGYR